MKKERAEKEKRRKKYQERKKLEERQGLELEHYEALLEIIGEEQTFVQSRMRLASSLLFVTGARIGEVLALKKNQVENLFSKQRPFFAFDRTKRGAKEQKAFLSHEGKEIITQRIADYKIVMKYSKPNNDFLFAAKQSETDHLSGQHFTSEMNSYLKILGERFNRKFTSHSFRKRYITHLWKSFGDIRLFS
uniref:Putative DNA breaking-rejoining enzyme n=1 Tax=Sarcinofilum mucosum TaxID=141643 RepID=A0A1W6EGE2_SARMC|nr:putative DNA breaking-rejoining enzyme [Sarcinofilum mucosum]ARK14461.1 putative DNA breaking-rejoining enzyme [Sarcinofilum mucosum]